jgi:acetyl-CoA carboxylase biotin carboxyl carrier protein
VSTIISTQDLETLVDLFEKSTWRSIHVTGNGVNLFISKDKEAAPTALNIPAQAGGGAAMAAAGPQSAGHAPQAAAPKAVANVPAGWIVVKASSLGSFYRAPKPGAEPFTSVGAKVTTESELCLIEVMKLFTTVRSSVAGTVREIYVNDGELVEHDQPLFLIEPNA